MAETPTQAFSRRMAHYRKRRNWSQEDLANELSAVGWSIHRVQVAKIEAGKRGVSLEEAITIAWVLGLPPAFLYLPLGEASDITLTPDGATVEPEAARQWALGRVPAMSSDRYVRMLGEWKTDLRPWWLFDAFEEASRAEQEAQGKMISAANFGDDDRKREANAAYVRALEDLHDAAEAIRVEGLIPVTLHERQVEAMRKVGRVYDGPTYNDDEEV